MGVIYRCTNLINNKVYVGQTIQKFDRRRKSHIVRANAGQLSKFYCAIRKYGKDNFSWEILENTDIDDINVLNKLEERYIKSYDSFNNGYNMTTGGLNKRYSEESKRKMSKSSKGRTTWMKGKTHTKEAKEKIRKCKFGKVGKQNGYSKQTKCLETGEIYGSARLASKATGIKYQYIRTACTGRRKTASSMHWKYLE